MTDFLERHSIHVYSPQQGNPWQARVTAPKSSLVNQWAFPGITDKSVREELLAKAGMTQKQQYHWTAHPNTGDASKAATPGISTQPAGRWHTSVITGQLRFTLWLFPRHVTSVHFQSLLSPLFSPGGNVYIWREVPGSKSSYHDDHCVISIELLKISNVCIFIINVKCVFRNTLLILTSLV